MNCYVCHYTLIAMITISLITIIDASDPLFIGSICLFIYTSNRAISIDNMIGIYFLKDHTRIFRDWTIYHCIFFRMKNTLVSLERITQQKFIAVAENKVKYPCHIFHLFDIVTILLCSVHIKIAMNHWLESQRILKEI